MFVDLLICGLAMLLCLVCLVDLPFMDWFVLCSSGLTLNCGSGFADLDLVLVILVCA